MGGLDGIHFENAGVERLAHAVTDIYNPTIKELDVGVAVLHYPGGVPPVSQREGQQDGVISDQEYLQGLIRFILNDPVAREPLAVRLNQETGICLPMLLSDCDPATHEDEGIRGDLLAQIAAAKVGLDHSASDYSLKLFEAIQGILANSKIQILSKDEPLQTYSAWEVLSGRPTSCVGLQNVESAVVYLASYNFDYQFQLLFQSNGIWEEHVLGSVQVGGDLLYIDATQANPADRYVYDQNLSPQHQPVPISELEFVALNLINWIREDRLSAAPKMGLPDQKKFVDQALLLSPQSVIVLLEARRIYSEIGETQKSREFEQKVQIYYPSYAY